MRRIARGAIAVAILIAWAIPCHDKEAAAAAKARRETTGGHGAARAARGASLLNPNTRMLP